MSSYLARIFSSSLGDALITPIISRASLVIDSHQSRAGLAAFSDGHKRPFLVKHMQMAQSPEDKFSGLTFALFKGQQMASGSLVLQKIGIFRRHQRI